MTAEKRAEPTPGHSPEPWTTDPRAGHEAIVDADGLRVADFHIFGRSTANNHANVRRVIDTAAEHDRLIAEVKYLRERAANSEAAKKLEAERDRLKAVNAELVAALKGLFDIEWNRSQVRRYSLRRENARVVLAKVKESTS
jgi:hypothetical protein